MKGRTTWAQMFVGNDGRDRLVMTYNRYGSGAPMRNNLRVNGYDFNGIFVAGVLMARFWRDVNGELILAQPTCKNARTVVGDFNGLASKGASWRRLVAASNPDAYSPSEYEWTNTGTSESVMRGSTATVQGPMTKNYGNVNEFVAGFSLNGDGESKIGYWDYGHVHMYTRVVPGASVGWNVRVKVDDFGFIEESEVISSRDEIERRHAVGGTVERPGEPAPWSDWEERYKSDSDGGYLVAVRQVTSDDERR